MIDSGGSDSCAHGVIAFRCSLAGHQYDASHTLATTVAVSSSIKGERFSLRAQDAVQVSAILSKHPNWYLPQGVHSAEGGRRQLKKAATNDCNLTAA